jgi:hypothetical protein
MSERDEKLLVSFHSLKSHRRRKSMKAFPEKNDL